MRATSLLLMLLPMAAQAQAPAAGRWDLVASSGSSSHPMWLEVTADPTLGGRLQGGWGHALPLQGVRFDGKVLSFPMPSEQPVTNPSRFTARINGDALTGEIVTPSGAITHITGSRAPSLARTYTPEWDAPIDLLADGLSGWEPRGGGKSGWSYVGGILTNTPPSVDLLSKQRFVDFRLEIEARLPPKGNSGIYLRGRHEVQVQDDYGKPPCNRCNGGVYGQLTPTSNPATPAGEWQRYEITFVGRRLTVVLNGVAIIDRQEVPGITGGAIDSNEAAPGPLMLQGDHSGVEYRHIRIYPAK